MKIAACGICRSDLHIIRGDWPRPLPVVVGHEAAGTVVAVGPGVTTTEPGQRVIFTGRRNCGHCFYCDQALPLFCEGGPKGPYDTFLDGRTRFSKDGQPIYHMARIAAFAEHQVTLADQLIPMPPDLPFTAAALIGCAVLTGVGATINTAQVQPASTVAVIGGGGRRPQRGSGRAPGRALPPGAHPDRRAGQPHLPAR